MPCCVSCRPDRNAARIAAGAARLSMPPFPEARFVEAVAETVKANAGGINTHDVFIMLLPCTMLCYVVLLYVG